MQADGANERTPRSGAVLAARRWQRMVRRPAWLLAGFALLVAIPAAVLQRDSAHTTSKLATIESLVREGSFQIERSTYSDTIDKVKIGEHFYSHQPPGHAVLAALVYFPLYHLGIRFRDGKNPAVPLVAFFTNGLCTMLGLVLMFRALAWWGLNREWRVGITALTGVGTLLLPYSTTVNVHGFVAAWLFFGFYLLVESETAKRPNLWIFLAGFAFSLSASVEHSTAGFYAAFGLDLLLRRERRKHLIWFLLPACLTALPTLAYYFAISGSFKPVAARPELFRYPGSEWGIGDMALTGATRNSLAFALRYAAGCLLGPDGILIYCPLLLVALYGMARCIRQRLRFWREAVAVACGSLLMLVYYSFASTNYGGAAYSIRWLVAVVFVVCFFAGAAKEIVARHRRVTAVLAALSVFFAVGGLASPWQHLGYLGPVAKLNSMRAPLGGMAVSFQPEQVARGADGKWTFDATVEETGGRDLDVSILRFSGVRPEWESVWEFRKIALPAHGRVTRQLRIRSAGPPYQVKIVVGARLWTGRRVETAMKILQLLP